MKKLAFALAVCGLWVSPGMAGPTEQVWLGVDGQPVHTDAEARQLVAARELCRQIEHGYGILGEPADLTVSCMASQGFTLTGTHEAQTRPVVPGGR